MHARRVDRDGGAAPEVLQQRELLRAEDPADSAVERVMTPNRWPRTVMGTLTFERAPISSMASRCVGLSAAAL